MIVVSGESLLDVFAGAESANGLALEAVVGGSPLNVAVGLARLGQPVMFFGSVSRDFLGERIERLLRAEGIATAALVRCEAPTTLSLVGVDAAGSPSYRFYGAGGADRQLQARDMALLPPQVQAVHVGSYACVVEPVAATVRALVEARQQSAVVSYDPNVRLNVEPDPQRWRDRVAWMSTRAHIMKLSDEDFERLYPGGDPQAQAAHWLHAGVRVVALTRGAAGASLWTREGRADVAAPAVTVVDTVGAGDAFQAALLAGLARCHALSVPGLDALTLAQGREVAAYAVRAASLTCTRRGPDLPRQADLAGD
jgi:fructokinase